jgi:hypothetical protein
VTADHGNAHVLAPARAEMAGASAGHRSANIRFLHDTLGIRNRERLAMLGRDAGLHCFRDEEWLQVLKTRPARRPPAGRPTEPKPATAA